MILLVHEQSSMSMELHIKSYMAVCKSQQTEAKFCVFIRLWYLDKFRTPKSCGWGPQPWKSITNLDSGLKNRAITQPTKVRLIKATVIPVVIYGCDVSWTIKKAEYQRTDALKLWCWRRLLKAWESCGLHGGQTSQS